MYTLQQNTNLLVVELDQADAEDDPAARRLFVYDFDHRCRTFPYIYTKFVLRAVCNTTAFEIANNAVTAWKEYGCTLYEIEQRNKTRLLINNFSDEKLYAASHCVLCGELFVINRNWQRADPRFSDQFATWQNEV